MQRRTGKVGLVVAEGHAELAASRHRRGDGDDDRPSRTSGSRNGMTRGSGRTGSLSACHSMCRRGRPAGPTSSISLQPSCSPGRAISVTSHGSYELWKWSDEKLGRTSSGR